MNGGFETGDFSGWTQGEDGGFRFVTQSRADTGSDSAQLGPVNEGTLAQEIDTPPNGDCILTFSVAANGIDSSCYFRGSIAGQVVDASQATNTFSSHTISFAGGGAQQLLFQFTNPPAFYFLDSVTLTCGS